MMQMHADKGTGDSSDDTDGGRVNPQIAQISQMRCDVEGIERAEGTRRRAWIAVVACVSLAAACGGGAEAPTGTAAPVTPTAVSAVPSPAPSVEVTATPAPATSPTVQPGVTPAPVADALEPIGFPLDPATRTDRVTGTPGTHVVSAGAGATVRETSERLQVSDDPVQANEDGWNCRVHVEYEGRSAVDWYVQPGQPVHATMDGEAMLILNTVSNAFDHYGVPREPYLGNPDRARAPVSPFPGPGGGMGLYVSIVNDRYRIDLGHLSLDATIANVPAGAFSDGHSRSTDYRATFAVPRSAASGDIIATWRVRRGDVVGFTGDTGYSEAPHLHYAITRRSDGAALCATEEAGFEDGGWLLRGG